MQASAGGCPKPGGRPQPWPSSAPAPAGAGSAREVRPLLAIVLGGGCTFLLCICLHLHLFHLHLLLLPLLLLPLLLRALWTSRWTQGRKSGELTRGPVGS